MSKDTSSSNRLTNTPQTKKHQKNSKKPKKTKKIEKPKTPKNQRLWLVLEDCFGFLVFSSFFWFSLVFLEFFWFFELMESKNQKTHVFFWFVHSAYPPKP